VARGKAAGMPFEIFERHDTKFTQITRTSVIGEYKVERGGTRESSRYAFRNF